MFVFLIFVLYFKYLYIFLVFINVMFKWLLDGLGLLLLFEVDGKLIDFENFSEDVVFGCGKIEDFIWKGMFDFVICIECGCC